MSTNKNARDMTDAEWNATKRELVTGFARQQLTNAQAKTRQDLEAKLKQQGIEPRKEKMEFEALRKELQPIAEKHGIVDPDALIMADFSTIELGTDGKPKNAEAFILKFKESKPYLFGSQASNTSNTKKTPSRHEKRSNNALDMSDAEWKAHKRKYGLR